MDINIDDILAELDRDTTAVDSTGHTQQGNQSSLSTSDIPANNTTIIDVSPQQDFKQLMVHWRNERCSPELLSYPAPLVERMLSRIQSQMETIENISMGFLESMSQGPSDDNGDKLTSCLLYTSRCV